MMTEDCFASGAATMVGTKPDWNMAHHWIDRYAAGIDDELQLDRVADALGMADPGETRPCAVPADLADWMRAIYAKMPPFPITPETCDAATDALHEFCLILGVYNIGPDDLAGDQP